LYDKREGRAEGERRFQREGPITEKDLDMAMVVLVRGTKSSRLPRERRAVVPKLGSADAWGSVRL